MVELSEEIIDVLKKVKDVIIDSNFEIKYIKIGDTGFDGEMIQIDIRRHEVKEEDD